MEAAREFAFAYSLSSHKGGQTDAVSRSIGWNPRYVSSGARRRAYEMLGSHPCEEGGRRKWHFCVWAPNAKHVALVGSFNHYDRSAHPMKKQYDGTWELRLDEEILWRDVPEDGYPTYKYAVWGADDIWRMKADPYAFYSELRPNNASRLYDLEGYEWGDAEWLKTRHDFNPYQSPVNIYRSAHGFLAQAPGRKLLFLYRAGGRAGSPMCRRWATLTSSFCR